MQMHMSYYSVVVNSADASTSSICGGEYFVHYVV